MEPQVSKALKVILAFRVIRAFRVFKAIQGLLERLVSTALKGTQALLGKQVSKAYKAILVAKAIRAWPEQLAWPGFVVKQGRTAPAA
jgi:hypothetical protein